LVAQRAMLEARIRREQNRQRERDRKADTRRKILAGARYLTKRRRNRNSMPN
jgi:hypothetical protein